MDEATARKHAIYSQSACNVAGLLYSVTDRAATVEDPAADPVLRLLMEQVNFLTGLARTDAVVMMEIMDRDLDLPGLLAALTQRREELIASPEWRTIGSAVFELDLTIRALTVLTMGAMPMEYGEAYRRCDKYVPPVEEEVIAV